MAPESGVGFLGGEDGVAEPLVVAGGDLGHESAVEEVCGPVEAVPGGGEGGDGSLAGALRKPSARDSEKGVMK